MNDDDRCCGTGTCIINNEGYCGVAKSGTVAKCAFLTMNCPQVMRRRTKQKLPQEADENFSGWQFDYCATSVWVFMSRL